MSRLFFYKVMYDGGGAPCAFDDALSLAICKPQIRATARRGDWIFGFGAQRLGEKLIYIARVDEILPAGEYYRDPRYTKRPDAVYEWQGRELRWKEGSLYHDPSATEHDVGLAPNYERAVALVSKEFRYFGRNSTDEYKRQFPILAESISELGQGYRVNHSDEVSSALISLIERVWTQQPSTMILGVPHDAATNACDLPHDVLNENVPTTGGRDCRATIQKAMPTLEDAIALAMEAHRGQKDRVGEPYILHPLRVMFRLGWDAPEAARMAAVLHDVVEDTRVKLHDLRRLGYSEEVLTAVELLSRRPGDSYEQFIERVLPNAIARMVKRADLEDNMELRRLSGLTEKDLERLSRYRSAWARIVAAD